MPRITSVEPQKSSKRRSTYGRKNPKRFNIFLDGQFAFGADEDLVVDYRLIKGKIIDQSLLEKLLFETEAGKLMERMYSLFNIRQRSEKEVRDYLKKLSFKRRIKDKEEISETVIGLVIQKLTQKRLLDDEVFAKAWLEARSKKKGTKAIKGELFQKGISKDIIEEVISQSSSRAYEQEAVADQLLQKRLPRWQNLAYQEKKKKSYDFLLRRGFDYDLVRNLVEKKLRKEYNFVSESDSEDIYED